VNLRVPLAGAPKFPKKFFGGSGGLLVEGAVLELGVAPSGLVEGADVGFPNRLGIGAGVVEVGIGVAVPPAGLAVEPNMLPPRVGFDMPWNSEPPPVLPPVFPFPVVCGFAD
jgi:hypothetical protein